MGSIDRTQRRRWNAYRSQLGMTDHDRGTEEFAGRGLAIHVREPSVRILILPADPESTGLSFGDWVASLLPPQPSTPWGGQLGLFGREVATSDAILRAEPATGEGDVAWEYYLAILRNGGIEMEMGSAGAWAGRPREGQESRRFFQLASIIRWVWTGLDLHRQVVATDLIAPGPVEVCVALRQLGGSVLAALGEGWEEPYDSFRMVPVGVEGDALLRLEVDDLTNPDTVKAVALDVGDRVDNCFGVRQHRHLANRGDHAGEFVPGR